MSTIRQFDYGWVYLLSGLALTVAAIVLPAHQDLLALEQKQDAIAQDVADLHKQIEIYQSFLDELKAGDEVLQQRVLEMQLNKPSNGTAIVIDQSAAKTPLDWVAERARQKRVVQVDAKKTSTLSQFAMGRGRLWLAGGGVFVMFIGLIRPVAKQKMNRQLP